MEYSHLQVGKMTLGVVFVLTAVPNLISKPMKLGIIFVLEDME